MTWATLLCYPPYPSQDQQQYRNLILNNVPEQVVVYPQIAMCDTVARTYYRSPGNFRVGHADSIGNMGSRFANEFQIPQRGIVGERVTDEGILIHSVGKGLNLLREVGRVSEA